MLFAPTNFAPHLPTSQSPCSNLPHSDTSKTAQLVLPNANLDYPLTLGLVREAPCRQLAVMAIERFDALGLWRQPRAEVVLVAVSLFFIARRKYFMASLSSCISFPYPNSSANLLVHHANHPKLTTSLASFSANYCRPIANMVVHLLRQYLSSLPPVTPSNPPAQSLIHFIHRIGPLVLMSDARCAAETGNRPLFTEDDLDDTPLLREWLERDYILGAKEGTTEEAERLEALFAGVIRLMRSFAAEFHKREWCFFYLRLAWPGRVSADEAVLAGQMSGHKVG
jgi:hypothetical protein